MSFEYQIARMIGLAPQFLVMVIGVVVALKRLPMHPRPCWLVLAALGLDGVANLGMPVVMQLFASLYFMNPGQSQTAWMFLSAIPYGLINGIVWGLVLFAVFDRPEPPKFLKEDDLDRDILDR